MANKRKPPTPSAPVSDEQLTQQVRDLLDKHALTKTQLAKKLPKAHAERGLELARGLARTGALHRFAKAKTEVFYSEDPIARLDRLGPELLGAEPLGATTFKAKVKAAAPNHEHFFPDWLKTALARRLVYEHPGKKKTYTTEPPRPDLRLLLKKTLTELTKLLPALEQQRVSREQVIDFLRSELRAREPVAAAPSAPSTSMPSVSGASRSAFLDALRRFAADNPSGALLPVRELRARAGLPKHDFDAAALALSTEGVLVLHHHDHAAALSEADQNALVRDARGRHYVGVALRGSA